MKECILSIAQDCGDLLDIQVLSRSIESMEIKNIEFSFRLFVSIQEEDPSRTYLDFKDTVSTSDIYSFISSVQEFLGEQSIYEI